MLRDRAMDQKALAEEASGPDDFTGDFTIECHRTHPV